MADPTDMTCEELAGRIAELEAERDVIVRTLATTATKLGFAEKFYLLPDPAVEARLAEAERLLELILPHSDDTPVNAEVVAFLKPAPAEGEDVVRDG